MKKIRLGIINSTYVKISPFTKKGTEIFANILIKSLVKYYKNELAITSFCSGNSTVSTKKISVMYHPSSENKQVGLKNNHLFEMALFSKAIQMHSKFDLYHFNLGNGEFIFPFASFIKKPIVVTMHGTGKEPYLHRLFHLYKDVPNVYFVTISAYQRKNIPFLQHIKTIHHGIDTDIFAFNEAGNKKIIWSGRAVPEKGLDTVMQIARRLKKPAKIFPIIKTEYIDWLHEEILKKRDIINQIVKIDIDFNVARANLVKEYQQSKVFLFPLKWDEPFGLTMIESMSCGTPVIAYARGSVPEIVKDGETGFIVNPSDDDIRGNWIIKKTGIEGLCEAVEKIYSMPEDAYRQMRKACRAHVEDKFTVKDMIKQYMEVYKEALQKNKSKHHSAAAMHRHTEKSNSSLVQENKI